MIENYYDITTVEVFILIVVFSSPYAIVILQDRSFYSIRQAISQIQCK